METDSIRDDLIAAMGELEGGEDAVAAEGAALAPAQDIEAKPETGARVRDETGKFAKAPEGAAPTDTPEPAPAAEQDPPSETIRVPASLPAPLKAKFKDLPEEWRTAFLKRDEDVSSAKAQWDTKAQRLNRFDEIFAPRRNALALRGVDEFQTVQILLAAQDALDANPVQGLADLARSYGVDLRTVAAQTNGQAGGQPPVPDVLAPWIKQVETLSQTVNAQQQQAEARETASAVAEIEQFRADPKNLYFDNVKDRIAGLLRSGEAKTLPEAYETACWASPEIRPLLLKAQAPQPDAAQAASRAKAEAARRAAGSVTGAPGAAAQPPAGGSQGSIRDDLRAAWDQLA